MSKSEERRKMGIFAIRTTAGQERIVASIIYRRARERKEPIASILIPDGIRGFIFIEADNKETIRRITFGIPHVKGRAIGKIPIEQLEQFLVPKTAITPIKSGDIVEITSGPFRGERARVIKVDTDKEEAVVELLTSASPIPLRVHIDVIKVVRSESGGGT
ncbi:MAG: transcription elongation factor Spt5 [Candidatus Baldrarchaeia archaeon]